MLCARECPDWCIYIEAHKYLAPPRREGGKPRQRNKLDRFDIDYALCMYCGICVEVCPFEALFWTPEYEYSEPRIADLLHDKSRLAEWMTPCPTSSRTRPARSRRSRRCPDEPSLSPERGRSWTTPSVAQNIFFGLIAAVMVIAAAPGRHDQEHRARRAVPGHRAGRRRRASSSCAGRVHRRHPGARLHRRGHRAVPVRHHAHPGPHRAGGGRRPRAALDRRAGRASCWSA